MEYNYLATYIQGRVNKFQPKYLKWYGTLNDTYQSGLKYMYIVYQYTFACLEFLKGKNYNYMCIIELVNQIWSKYSNLLH